MPRRHAVVTRKVGDGHSAATLRVGTVGKSGTFRRTWALPRVSNLRHAHWLQPSTMRRYLALQPVAAGATAPQSVLALEIAPSAKSLSQNCDSCVYFHNRGNDLCGGNRQQPLKLLQQQHTAGTLVHFKNSGAVAGRLLDAELVRRSGKAVRLVQILVRLV